MKPIKIFHVISSCEALGIGDELTELTLRLPNDTFECEVFRIADRDPCVLLRMVRQIRRFRPDILHTWDSTAHFYGVPAAAFCRVPKIVAEKRKPGTRYFVQKYLDARTGTFITLRQTDSLPASKTVIIPPAAVPMKPHALIPAAELLGKLGFPLMPPTGNYYPILTPQYEPERRDYRFIPPDDPKMQVPFLIGMISPLDAAHRLVDALWSFVTLKTVNLNFHVLIIGDGKDREMLLRCRDDWKLFSRVHFLGRRADIDRLLPCFDMLLHLSPDPEQIGTISAALSCGIPVIAEASPEIQMVFDNNSIAGQTDLLIPATDDFRFRRRTAVKKILRLCEDEELRRSFGTVVRSSAFESAMQKRIEIYQELRSELAAASSHNILT